jgi:uncharacterized ferritin-like protein (DUF455 family)
MTVQAWCRAFVEATDAAHKLAPPAPPRGDLDEHWDDGAASVRIAAPGRPSEWRIVARGEKAPSAKALVNTAARVKLLLTFAHHELQAAELFCWAVLAFPDTPRAFKRGLVRLALEELEHLALYRAHFEALGGRIGDQPVRDWFWQRVHGCETPLEFCAFVGLGLEGGNLEHSARFARAFRAAGDDAGAAILERVEHDEIGHVAFGRTWFEHFSGAPLTFDAWARHLPHPISPALMRGTPLNLAARRRAGLDDDFLTRLANAPGVEVPRVEVPRAQTSGSTGAEEPTP